MENNKAVIDFIGDSVEYDQFCGTYLWGKKEGSDGMQMIGEIRGWGAIQNLFKTLQESEEFQDKLGNFIAEAITEKIQREKIV